MCSLLLSLETLNDVQSYRIIKRLAKALIRLRVCTGLSQTLLIAHTTLLEIHDSNKMVNLLSEVLRALPRHKRMLSIGCELVGQNEVLIVDVRIGKELSPTIHLRKYILNIYTSNQILYTDAGGNSFRGLGFSK